MSAFSVNLERIRKAILESAERRERVIVAIDGRCASGKSTLAAELARTLDCTLIHMDDFFLQPYQRTPERLAKPGENVDHERFLTEVLTPLAEGKDFTYRPWDCHGQSFGEPITVEPSRVSIVEGSYACHPELWEYYDLHIFLTVDEKTQLARIVSRNGEVAAEVFRSKWIPLEERYFDAFRIAERCELLLVNR